ncbi:MAG: radical SAM protein [Marinilabiliales bacterium]|nr:radical SAM protein [Marinilabiliales bacterium]
MVIPVQLMLIQLRRNHCIIFYLKADHILLAVAGCNLACLNCQNWQISQVSPKDTRNYELMPADVYKQAKEYKCLSISYTYSEPIVFYEYVIDSAKIAKQNGIKNVLVSAGYINEKPLRELTPFIDAANIDLKSFDDDIYNRLNGWIAGTSASGIKNI